MQRQFYDLIATGTRSAVFMLILTIGPIGIVNIFCQDDRSGELEPGARIEFTFACRKGEKCIFKGTFGPKHQKEQGEAECQKFKLMSFVDGQWVNTASGYLEYVEDSTGTEVLRCLALTSAPDNRKKQAITIQVTNGNIWKGLFELERVARK